MPISWDNESVGTQRSALQDFTPGLGYTVREAAASTWADNPVVRAYQWGGNLLQNDGEKLNANDLDALIKGAGVTNFTLPENKYSKDAAMSLIERQRQKQMAAEIDASTGYSLGETPIRALTRAATMMVDPLNIAAMFVPGLGEGWAAARIAGGASRFVTNVARGATQGAAGMGALEAINYPLARQLHDDYSSTDSLLNVLTGAAIGGTLHGFFGRAPREAPQALPLAPAQMELDLAAKQTALAQMLQDRPVDVEHLVGKENSYAAQVERGQRVGMEPSVQGDAVAAAREAEAQGQVTPDLFPDTLEAQREALRANREKNILDGDGQPPRTEPAPAGDQHTALMEKAQADALAATQQAEAATQALRERMAPKGETVEPTPVPELTAADKAVAQAEAEAKAFQNIADCQRLG